MGKLRDSLTGMKTLVVEVEARVKRAELEAAKLNTNLNAVFDSGIKGGVEVLYSYLLEKFKKAGDQYAKHHAETILQHRDSNVLKFVSGIAQGKQDLEKQYTAWSHFTAQEVNGIKGDLARIATYVADIEKQLSQKKKKLLQSAEYKTKIAGYETTLEGITNSAKVLAQGLADYVPSINKKCLDTFTLSTSTTLKELDESGMLMDLKTLFKNAERDAANGIATRRKFRENGDLAAATKLLAAWVSTADDMEEKSVDSGPAPEDKSVAKLNKVVVKLLGGSKVLGRADKGLYDPGKGELSVQIDWTDLVSDPLKQLQKKLSLEANYDDAKRGIFLNDMKLAKLGGNLTTATFKN